ncbi:type IV secretion system protein TraC [Asticcacaulis excentricus]|uniref:Type-IV secretion system protein TraC n=1 Tax=Asticcacaulis excentricus (strain ATCC 15261 / DSM 4724 / KCTC 12464 / NCIMB 9791 / VKM B-1370 / CB 48) TaxID=573065 RepID=E8RVX7_ASTEC|nr:type IV secretion system protein TraC [Asticcacaulis excentricus]ADU15399.1 type-IV secretion system protein TraC [Asticcacaulis excentricus CB 48]
MNLNFDAVRREVFRSAQKLVAERIFGDMPSVDTGISCEFPPSLSGYLPYRSFDEVRQLYVQDATVGLVLELIPLLGVTDAQHALLAQVFNDALPDGAHVQIINYASPRTGHIVDSWARSRSAGGEIFEELARHRRQHLMNGIWTSFSKSAPFSMRDYRVILAIEVRGDVSGPAGDALAELREVIKGTLASMGGAAFTLMPDQLLSFCAAVLNPTSSTVYDSIPYDREDWLNQQIVRRDTTVTQYRDRLVATTAYAGDGYDQDLLPKGSRRERWEFRAFSPVRYPENASQAVVARLIGDFFNNQLQNIGSNLTVLYFSPMTLDESKTTVEMKTMRTSQQASSPTAKFFPAIQRAADDWTAANQAVSMGAKLCHMGMFAISITPLQDADRAERQLRAVWGGAGFELSRSDVLHLQTLLAALPLTMGDGLADDYKAHKRLRRMPTSCMAMLAPFQGEFRGFQRPDMLFLGRRGQPFFFSPFSNEEEGMGGGNHNVSVIGASGSGKSVLMQEMAGGLRGRGADVIVLDDGYSFRNTCKIQGGQFIEFNLSSDLNINPFSLVDYQEADLDEEYRSESINALKYTVLQMAKGDDLYLKEELGMIERAVVEVFETKRAEGGIEDVALYLEAHFGDPGRAMAIAMEPYRLRGSYGKLYNGQANLEISSPFTVFELSPLESKKDLRAVVILSLLMVIRQRMKHGGRARKKALFIDEAWQLLGDGAAGPFIEGFARRCRKEGGALITGTQSLEDYQRTAGGRACIQNSEWNIILKLKPESVDAFANEGILRASEAELELIRSLFTSQGEYSEAYIRGAGTKFIGRLVLDPYSLALYSTKPEVLDAIERLVSAGYSAKEAVRSVAFKVPIETHWSKAQIRQAELLMGDGELKPFIERYGAMSSRERRIFAHRLFGELEGNDAQASL